MKKFKHIYFCDYSQTYRSYPENYWLASLINNEVVFDSWDGAIKGFNYKNDVLKLHSDINKCRKAHSKITKTDDLTPVIVISNYDVLGVQFWRDYAVHNKVLINTDNSKSYFVAKL